VWLGFQVKWAHEQRRAVIVIEDLGGTIRYDYECLGFGGRLPKKPPSKWLGAFMGEEYSLDVYGVHYRYGLHFVRSTEDFNRRVDSSVADAKLEHLIAFHKLRMLDLSYTPVTDRGLKHLKNLKSLVMLTLDSTQITDAGLKHLKGLTSLNSLSLNNTQVTNAGVEKLQQALPKCKIDR
jgi:hypothetical protein